jgi:hypothetical protein
MLNMKEPPVRSVMALPFRPVDIDAQARKYRLEQRGAEDGRRNYPQSDAEDEAQAEIAIIGAVDADRQRCLTDLSATLRACRDALARLQTAMDVGQMRQAADDATVALDTIRERYATDLCDLREMSEARDEEFTEFRDRHRLRRPPRQPTSRGHTVVLAAFFVTVEAIFNATFFMGATDEGLLGGGVVAAVCSFLNIALGVFSGWFPWRWMRHRVIGINLFGFLMAAAASLAGLFLNVLVAHYRDVAAAATQAPDLPTVFTSVITHPVGLHSIQSWLLLVLGVGFEAFAIFKGYGLDDPYPGYGAMDRRRAAAREDYEELRQELIEDAAEIKDTFADELRVKIETLRASSTQREQLLATRNRSLTEYDAHEAHLANAARQLLAVYRRANEEARSTPPPLHFRQRFAFPDKGSMHSAIQALLGEQGMEIDAQGLLRELDGLRQRVLDTYRKLIEANSE